MKKQRKKPRISINKKSLKLNKKMKKKLIIYYFVKDEKLLKPSYKNKKVNLIFD